MAGLAITVRLLVACDQRTAGSDRPGITHLGCHRVWGTATAGCLPITAVASPRSGDPRTSTTELALNPEVGNTRITLRKVDDERLPLPGPVRHVRAGPH